MRDVVGVIVFLLALRSLYLLVLRWHLERGFKVTAYTSIQTGVDLRFLAAAAMASVPEYDQSLAFLSRIPQWDGNPSTFRTFKRDVTWWLESEDLTKTLNYNLAARFAQRQRGAVRRVAMEMDPVTLRADPGAFDQNGNELRPPAPDLGIRMLMVAFEEMTGLDPPTRKGELMEKWHMFFYRRPGERVIDYCTRGRELISELKTEGIKVSEEEAGWMLQTRAGLSENRLELLQTATEGDYTFFEVQKHMIRLFKRVHEFEKRNLAPSSTPRFGSSAASSAGGSTAPSTTPSARSWTSKGSWSSQGSKGRGRGKGRGKSFRSYAAEAFEAAHDEEADYEVDEEAA